MAPPPNADGAASATPHRRSCDRRPRCCRLHPASFRGPCIGPGSASAEGEQQRPGSGATIEAKPQLRNLSADIMRFTPTSLRVKRDPAKRTTKDVPTAPTVSSVTAPTKDDAYELFMKEMENLL
ncbi:hypothetical protein MTO96_043826 [Rhipicephalus appendiculatus]